VYVSGPVVSGPLGDLPGAVPHVERIERRRFDGPGHGRPGSDERAFLREYMSDLARPYGLALRERVRGGPGLLEGADLLGGDGPREGTGLLEGAGLLEGEGGHRYEEMAEELIAALVPLERPVDLVVLAFAVPDVRAGRTTASYRGRACPGDPLAFAVCDQGPSAAFTGLRLIRELSRTGGCRRSLLLILEQPCLPYQLSAPIVLPAQATGVGLLCDTSGPARLVADRQHTAVPPEGLDALLAVELADLCAGPAPVTLVLGDGLAGYPVPSVHRVRTAPAGQPSTGVWWALADELDTAGRVVLVEYDPALGYLCLAAFEVGAGPVLGGRACRRGQAT
jgi:4-hydroxymandelate oxidase